MLIEPKNPNLKEIIRRAKYKGQIHCPHDFWNKSTKYGDVVLCTVCHQYFTKIKHLPWIVKRERWNDVSASIADEYTHHLDGDCYINVPVRITQ